MKRLVGFGAAAWAALACMALGLATPVRAQHTGPLPPPQRPKMEAPAIPVEEIIRRFAEKEAEFKLARDEYSYKQTVMVREYDEDGRPGGEFRRNSEVIFLDKGERFERVTYEPPVTLRHLSMTPEDMHDLESIQPFVLTTEEVPDYKIDYQGREKVDELTTYVFDVRPKRIERGRRYFQGRIWVDDVDLQIVKTRGKAVPDIREGNQENLFPEFETYRENIDGKYWFPTYTSADDVLRFSSGPVRMKILVRYTDYKKRAVSTRIIGSERVEPPPAKPPR
ncbi:MAG: hypothetical protein ACRD5G_17165 [Candidatus Acidiferrales bacterium]